MLELLAMAVAALLSENLLLTRSLGAGSVLRELGGVRRALAMGGTVTLLMVLCAPLLWAVDSLLLRTLGLEYLRLLAFLAVIVLVEEALRAVTGLIPPLKAPMGELLPLAAAGSAVLGGGLLAAQDGLALVPTVLFALLSGAGFTLAALLLAGIRGRLAFSECPKAFRGAPLALVTAGLLAMAFIGFVGIHV